MAAQVVELGLALGDHGEIQRAAQLQRGVGGRAPVAVRDDVPDEAFVDFRLVDREEAVRSFLDALGVPPERVPSDPDAQAGLYRSLLAGKRVLVLLDNARDAAQVRPLVPGGAPCLVAVTSRHQLTGLVAAEAAKLLVLDTLPPDEAHAMLAHRLGAEPAATLEIINRCARLPLALAIVAARAAGALLVVPDAQPGRRPITTCTPPTPARCG